METEEKGQVKAVLRTFTLLECIADNPRMGISELARETGIAKATVFRFVQTFKEMGFVQPLSGDEGFLLTMKLFKLGSRALEYQDLAKLAHPFLERLSDLSHETVHLAIRDEAKIIYIDKIDSRFTLQMRSAVGRTAPLHCTGIGKVLAAWEPEERLDQIMEGYDWTPYTEKTLTNREDFRREMAWIRDAGYAEDREEHEQRIFCIAVPIRSHTGKVIAGLSVSQPIFRMDWVKKESLIKALLEESAKLSELLGMKQEN
ncbi:MAG: IclR family transcriptional regulator C-terminal domain-containing protein [Spirochaetales bacterium]|nr:IclR family transcriptional regulator C-terminal domain-containing protein [Spirochaetales bacterium]